MHIFISLFAALLGTVACLPTPLIIGALVNGEFPTRREISQGIMMKSIIYDHAVNGNRDIIHYRPSEKTKQQIIESRQKKEGINSAFAPVSSVDSSVLISK